MAFSASVTNHVSKGVQNNVSGTAAWWFGTNFNMPVHNFFDNSSSWSKTDGPLLYVGASSSFDLTTFEYGYEICNGVGVFLFDNTTGSGSTSVSTTINIKWTTTGNSVLNGGTYNSFFSTSLAVGFWGGYALGANIGAEPSEIATSTTYDFRASASGTPNITEVVTPISFTNVPSTTTQIAKSGYIWVEGNNLCYINANEWKHTMVGNDNGSSPGSSVAGALWMDTSNVLHWVGFNGHDYSTVWKVQQFGSFYSGSATGSTFAGTQNAGQIWVDAQFGGTHLAYIGTDGFKYLTGAGGNPY